MNASGHSARLDDDAQRALSQYAYHRRVLEAMAHRRPLAEVLTHVVDAIESAAVDVLGSILLVDESGTRLLRGAAPSLPASYTDALHGMSIGPAEGSCGTAAFTRSRVVASDILTDPLWDAFRHLALPIGLRSCWSTPILGRTGDVLGTFAVYSRQPRHPSLEELRVIEELTSLASVAIQQARAEQMLARREAYYRALIESAPTVILSMDGTGRIADANPAALRLWRLSRDEFVGRSLLTCCAADAHLRVAEWIGAALHAAGPLMCDVPVLEPDGRTRWLLLSLACVARSELPNDAELLAVGQDITERVESESEVRRSERQLRDTQKMEAISRLAGGIAHDFNNLLTVIQGNTALALQRDVLDAEALAALHDVESATARAATLTRQLLAFSHRDTMPVEVVDLHIVLAAVQRATTPLVSDRVTMRVNETDQPLPVQLTRAAVEDALASVLLHARDSMPDGGLLEITLDDLMLDDVAAEVHGVIAGRYARLSIRDTGPRLDDDALARAFEPFPATVTPGRRGGMGIATLYALARRLQGTVVLDSNAERGTIVTLVLPLAVEHAVSRPTSDARAGALAGLTVLVVEDEDAVRHLMRRVLRAAGCRVILATDGEDAMAVWHRHGDEIDALVTDVVMPRMTGPELVERLRSERPDLPVVVCSGYSDTMSSAAPADDPRSTYLSKPFSLQALSDAVARVSAAVQLASDRVPAGQ